MNQYIVNEPQAKAINDGARLLIVEIDESKANEFIKYNQYSFDFGTLIEEMQKSLSGEYISHSFKKVVDHILPLKQGNEIFIAEEFQFYGNGIHILYKADKDYKDVNEWRGATEMTSEISRFKFKVGEVSIKRVQNILYSEIHKALHGDEGIYIYKDIEEYFLNWLKDQGIDYNANPWVALAELKKDIK